MTLRMSCTLVLATFTAAACGSPKVPPAGLARGSFGC